jgi:DNA-binding response OmpR family regulator
MNINCPYDLDLKVVIKKLREIYDSAPDEFIDKYAYLFIFAFREEKITLSNDDFSFLPDKLKILIDGSEIKLERMMGELFYVLSSKPGKVCLSDALENYIWDGNHDNTRNLKVLVCKLNKRLKGSRLKILNVYGKGYFLDVRTKS